MGLKRWAGRVLPPTFRARLKDTLVQLRLRRYGGLPQDFFGERRVPVHRMEFVGAEAFPLGAGPAPWIDRPDALELVGRKRAAGELDDAQAAVCRDFIEQGYFVAKGLIPQAEVDTV